MKTPAKNAQRLAKTRPRQSVSTPVPRARKAAGNTVRLRDVARYVGVSTASVSRALNSPHLVSAALGARIREASELLQWVPNGAAKALASSRTRTIGVLIPTLGHQNFATLVEALQLELASANYTLIIACVEAQSDLRVQTVRKMLERGIEFLVLVGETQPEALYDLLKSRRVPYVITHTVARNAGHTSIGFDNYAAMVLLTEHLLTLGHRDFALIAPVSGGNDRIELRVAGVKDALARSGLGIRPQHFAEVPTGRRIEDGRAGFSQIWKRSPHPTALICTNDYIAIGAMIEAAASKVDIPRELSVVGFDDIDLASHLTPRLTTIRVPVRQIGIEIAHYVIELLNRGSAKPSAPLPAGLIVRESTAAPRVASAKRGSAA